MDEQLELVARRIIMRAIRHARYRVNKNGEPEHKVAVAIQRAVDYQVDAWVLAGVGEDMLTRGATAEPRLKSTSENGASVTLDYGPADDAVAWLLGGGLCPAAEAVLDNAGLLGGLPGVWR